MAKKRKILKVQVLGKKGHGKTYHPKSKELKNSKVFGNKKPIKETLTTLDELKDETLGKVGTKRRDDFEKKLKQELKKSVKSIDKRKFNESLITEEDLKGQSLDEMLTKNYGKKGTKERNEAEKRINEKAKNLSRDNKLKEKSEKKDKNKVDDILTKHYGKKGTKKRDEVDRKIKRITNNTIKASPAFSMIKIFGLGLLGMALISAGSSIEQKQNKNSAKRKLKK